MHPSGVHTPGTGGLCALSSPSPLGRDAHITAHSPSAVRRRDSPRAHSSAPHPAHVGSWQFPQTTRRHIVQSFCSFFFVAEEEENCAMNGESCLGSTCTREPFVPNPCVRVPQQRTASRRAAVLGVVCVADSAARLLLPVQQARAVA